MGSGQGGEFAVTNRAQKPNLLQRLGRFYVATNRWIALLRGRGHVSGKTNLLLE